MDTHVIISIAAIILYAAFVLYVGLGKGYTKSTVSSARGYFLGSGLGVFVLFFTTAATSYSTWIFMGAPGQFYRVGIGFATGITWQLVGIFLMGIWSPKFWRLSKDQGYITPADLVQDYYNPKGKAMRIVVAISQLGFCIPTMMAQVGGVGLAIYTLTGGVVPFWAGVLYVSTVVGIYVFFGGFKSQAWVDTAQGLLFTTAMWGSVLIMISRPELGGIAGLFTRLEEVSARHLVYWGAGEPWIWRNYLGFFIIQSIGITLSPYVWQRAYAANSGRNILKMCGLLGIMMTFGVMLPVMLSGLGGVALGVGTANADSIIVTVMNQYAPLFGILIVVGILAAGMSTISSISVSVSSIITVDLVKTFKPDLSDHQLRNIARICVLGLLFISMTAALMGTAGIIVLINTAMAGFAQMFWPVFGIFAWKRATKEGVMVGYLAGVILAAVLTGTGQFILGFIPGFWAFVVNGGLMIIISLMTKPIEAAQRTKFLEPLVRTSNYNLEPVFSASTNK